MTLKVVQSGSTVIDLEASPYIIVKFRPGDPDQRKEDIASVFAHGRTLLFAKHENPVMTIELIIYGTTTSAIDTAVSDISMLVDDVLVGIEHSTNAKYYVHFTPESAVEWRTQILRMAMRTEDVDRRQEDDFRLFTATMATRYFRRVYLDIERSPFWEKASLTELGLTNGNGTNITGGITVWNHNDGGSGHDNFTTIATTIGGTERTPLVVQFTNPGTMPTRVGDLYVSRNARNDPTSADSLLIYECESMSLSNGGAVQASVGYRSNDAYAKWTGTLSAYSILGYWTLTGAKLAKYGGRWFHVLAQVLQSTSDTYLGARLSVEGLTNLSETPMKLVVNNAMIDLGALHIPPYVLSGDMYDLNLELWGYRVGGAMSTSIDFVHLMPSEREDGYVHLKPQGYNIPIGWTLKYDGYDGTVSVFSGTGSAISNYQPIGGPLHVTPGATNQRLYWLWDKDTGDADATWWGTVRVWYRERRVSI